MKPVMQKFADDLERKGCAHMPGMTYKITVMPRDHNPDNDIPAVEKVNHGDRIIIIGPSQDQLFTSFHEAITWSIGDAFRSL